MRLVMMLAALGGAIWVAGEVLGTAETEVRKPVQIAQPELVTRAATTPHSLVVPATVKRLIEEKPVGPVYPVVSGEAQPIPVAVVTQLADGSGLARIKANSANVRSGPSKRSGVVGRLSRGEEVAVIGREGGWVQIRLEGDGFEGWVSASLLE